MHERGYAMAALTAGVISAAGEGVSGFREGDGVACMRPNNAQASARNTGAAQAVRLPDGVSFETAASVRLNGLTTASCKIADI